MNTNHLKHLAAMEAREAMRNGVVLRASTIPNKKRKASREACRKGAWS